MFEPLRKFTCPSCNAPLKAKEEQKILECQYCHTMVEVPQVASPNPTVVVIERERPLYTPRNIPYPAPSSPSTWRYMRVIFILVISGATFGFVRTKLRKPPGSPSFFSLSSSSVYLSEPYFHLPPTKNGASEMLVFAKESGSSTKDYMLLSLDEKTLQPKWQIPAFQADEQYSDHALADEEQIYFVKKHQLLALKRQNGAIKWQTSLRDELALNCEDCFDLYQNQITALTSDGTIQSFSTQDGKQLWSVRFDAPNSHYIKRFQDRILVVDEIKKTRVVKLLDLATGRLLQSFPNGKRSRFASTHVSYDLPFVLDQKDSSIYIFYGFGGLDGVQKWNLLTNEIVWEGLFPSGPSRSSSSGNFISFISSDSIFFSNHMALVSIQKNTGQMKVFPFPEDYTGNLITLSKDTLLVHMVRHRGTERHEIWGIDAQTGEHKQPYLPSENSEFVPSGHSLSVWGSDSKGKWSYVVTEKGLLILDIDPTQNRVSLQELDGKTLVAGPAKVLPISIGQFTQFEKFSSSEVLFDSRKLYRFNIKANAIEATGP